MLYFTEAEFKCKCGRPECDAVPVTAKLTNRLEDLRERLNEVMVITSASRCAFWNAKVGGVNGSQHLLGNAADIATPSASYAWRLLDLAMAVNFTGLGVGKSFIHLDVREGAPQVFGYHD